MDRLDIQPTPEVSHIDQQHHEGTTATEHESHCSNCFSTRNCREIHFSRANLPNIQCKIVMCQHYCGQEFHECKLAEHMLLCRNVKVACINAFYGCPLVMERRLIAKHLPVCPASVVVCNAGWQRKILHRENSTELEDYQRELLRQDERTVEEWRNKLPPLLSGSVQIALRCKHPGVLLGPSGEYNMNVLCSEIVAQNYSSDNRYPSVLDKSVLEATTEKEKNHTKSSYSDATIKLEAYASSCNRYLINQSRSPHRIKCFLFMCGREFRRDEYATHYRDVHETHQQHSNRLVYSQCPMRGHGCTFIADRIHPIDDNHRMVYNNKLEGLWTTQIQSDNTTTKYPIHNIGPRNICDIPIELLLLIVSFLDPLSLNCLSMTCSRMKEVCVSVIVTRGIVVDQWEKKPRNKGWEVVAKNWKFSTSFSPVRKWRFADVDRIYNHIENCPCNDRQVAEAPFTYNVTRDDIATQEQFWNKHKRKSCLLLKFGIDKNPS